VKVAGLCKASAAPKRTATATMIGIVCPGNPIRASNPAASASTRAAATPTSSGRVGSRSAIAPPNRSKTARGTVPAATVSVAVTAEPDCAAA